jgi:flagellin
MSLYVNTNVSSLNAQRNMANSSNSLDTSYQRLSSGLRINSAKDDAAGLQISNRLTSQIQGLDQGNRNANDGISLAQTAEGAMDEVTTMLQRMRTLAVQGANDTNTAADRTSLQTEVTALNAELDRISSQTTFGGIKLLDGTGGTSGTVKIQVGANASQTIDVDLTGKTDSTSLAVGTGSVSSSANASTFITAIDAAIATVGGYRANLGAVQNRFESTIRNQSNVSENLSAARSRIRDADFATETANMTKQNILQQASSAVLSQANQRPQVALSLLK